MDIFGTERRRIRLEGMMDRVESFLDTNGPSTVGQIHNGVQNSERETVLCYRAIKGCLDIRGSVVRLCFLPDELKVTDSDFELEAQKYPESLYMLKKKDDESSGINEPVDGVFA